MKRRRYTQYLVIRRRNLLGYTEYFGPMVSTNNSAQRDAERLFGKPDHTIEVKGWVKTPARIKAQVKDDPNT